MSIIIKAEPYGSSGDCEYQLSRALSTNEQAHCQAIAKEQSAWCEIYSFPSSPDDVLEGAGEDGLDIWREGCPMLHFIDPHPLIIPEIESYLASLD